MAINFCLLGTGLTHKLKVCQADSACCSNGSIATTTSGSLYTTVCHMSNQGVLPSSTGLVLEVNLLVSCIEAKRPAATPKFANWLLCAERNCQTLAGQLPCSLWENANAQPNPVVHHARCVLGQQ